jgi:anti-sigma regulatory factor (Ser/Thr protein kinase)
MTVRLVRAGAQARIEVRDQSDIGECRRVARKLAQPHGFDEAGIGRISIVATELATNIFRHGGGGNMLIQALEDGSTALLELLAIDRGPGMHNVAECLRDGYSTGGTPGTGLGAASRLSTVFDLFSHPGKGTVVLSRLARGAEPGSRSAPIPRAPPGGTLEFGCVCVALAGETECGDGWRIAEDEAMVSLLVVDGLGHGVLAAEAARAAAAGFEERPFDAPAPMLQALNRRLMGGRGAVAACAQLHRASGKLEYAGVGNISGAIIEPGRSRGMMSLNGTLGMAAVRSRQLGYEYPPGGVVVLHSDGVSARWQLSDYPGLQLRHPAVIAGVLFRDCGRPRDDATVLAARYRA